MSTKWIQVGNRHVLRNNHNNFLGEVQKSAQGFRAYGRTTYLGTYVSLELAQAAVLA